MEHYFSSIEYESVCEYDGPTTSEISVPVECTFGEHEHESLPMTSVLSCEDIIATSVDASRTPPLPAEQLNRNCQILALLRPDSPAEQSWISY